MDLAAALDKGPQAIIDVSGALASMSPSVVLEAQPTHDILSACTEVLSRDQPREVVVAVLLAIRSLTRHPSVTVWLSSPNGCGTELMASVMRAALSTGKGDGDLELADSAARCLNNAVLAWDATGQSGDTLPPWWEPSGAAGFVIGLVSRHPGHGILWKALLGCASTPSRRSTLRSAGLANTQSSYATSGSPGDDSRQLAEPMDTDDSGGIDTECANGTNGDSGGGGENGGCALESAPLVAAMNVAVRLGDPQLAADVMRCAAVLRSDSGGNDGNQCGDGNGDNNDSNGNNNGNGNVNYSAWVTPAALHVLLAFGTRAPPFGSQPFDESVSIAPGDKTNPNEAEEGKDTDKETSVVPSVTPAESPVYTSDAQGEEAVETAVYAALTEMESLGAASAIDGRVEQVVEMLMGHLARRISVAGTEDHNSVNPTLIVAGRLALVHPGARRAIKRFLLQGATVGDSSTYRPELSYVTDAMGSGLYHLSTRAAASELLWNVCAHDREELLSIAGTGNAIGWLRDRGLM